MDTLLKVVEYVLPACASFGPFFMIMVARGDTDRRNPLTRRMNYLGLGMVIVALTWLYLALGWQHSKLDILQLRVDYLEKQIEAAKQPCPESTP